MENREQIWNADNTDMLINTVKKRVISKIKNPLDELEGEERRVV